MSDVKPVVTKKPDRFLKIKHVGYCWSQGGIGNTQFKDFVRYCQFQLCVLNRVLMKDPIWDEYTQEEILAEYFAHAFQKDANFVKEFEVSLSTGELLDFSEWADLQMKKDQEAEQAKILGQEDKVVFQPEDVMGET